MTRAQRIAIGVSAALVAALLVTLVLTRKDDTTSATPPGSSPASAPASSGGGQSTPTSQPKPPVTISSIEISAGADTGGGWGTSVALVAAGGTGPKATVRPGASVGQYAVTFDRPVRISPAVVQSVGTSADNMLLHLTWNQAAQSLTLTAIAYTSNIARTTAGTDAGRTTVELVRTPTPILSHDCIQVNDPVPYSKLYGTTKVSGTAQLFEAGPMTIVARVPGKGQTTTKAKMSSSSRVPFSKDVSLPLLSAPAEGYIAAYDTSAKDGSQICTVKVPVYMSPGG